jgi:hypothetical protein
MTGRKCDPTIEEDDPYCKPLPNAEKIDDIAHIKGKRDAAAYGNLDQGHVEGLRAMSEDKKPLIIVRGNKPAATRWYGDPLISPKPSQVCEHTGESGLVHHDGRAYHSDIDLFLVLTNAGPKTTPAWHRDTIDVNSPAFMNSLNQYLRKYSGIQKDMIQHGDQVSYLSSLNPKCGMQPMEQMGIDLRQKFVVSEEDGTLRVICGPVNVKRYFELRHIPWPFLDKEVEDSGENPEKKLLANKELLKFYELGQKQR